MGFIEDLRRQKQEEQDAKKAAEIARDRRRKEENQRKSEEEKKHQDNRERAKKWLSATAFPRLLEELAEVNGVKVHEMTWGEEGRPYFHFKEIKGTPDSEGFIAVLEETRGKGKIKGTSWKDEFRYRAIVIEVSYTGVIGVRGSATETLSANSTSKEQEAALGRAYYSPMSFTIYRDYVSADVNSSPGL